MISLEFNPNTNFELKLENKKLFIKGKNTNFELGNENSTYSINEFLLIDTDVIKYDIGFYHIAYLKENGELYTFGNNTFNQCGDKKSHHSGVSLLEKDVEEFICGSLATYYFKNGFLYISGTDLLYPSNMYIKQKNKMFDVISDFINPYNKLELISIGLYSKSFILRSLIDNTLSLYCCGDNTSGKLPFLSNTIIDYPTKVDLSPITKAGIKSIAISKYNTFILDNEKHLYVFGDLTKITNGFKTSKDGIKILNGVNSINMEKNFTFIDIHTETNNIRIGLKVN